jgi:hypothetical protein
MPTLLRVYHQLCTDDDLPDKRRKDLLTALRYLAASYDTTPDQLSLTPEIEATYRQRLRDFLTAQDKGHSTIRNAIQGIGQYLKAYHGTVQTPLIPVQRPDVMKTRAAWRELLATSPYQHHGWLYRSRFHLTPQQWPLDIQQGFDAYRHLKRHDQRASTQHKTTQDLMQYVGFLSMSDAQRLDHLPPTSRDKLALPRYRDDLSAITTLPTQPTWIDLFDPAGVEGFVTWHAWRVHTPLEAQVAERPPSKPTTSGLFVANTMALMARTMAYETASALSAYAKGLDRPHKLHDKSADYHTFSFVELEEIALKLIAESRRMSVCLQSCKAYPGSGAAIRFQTGLMLMLGWRYPIRSRNWCEALLERNVRQRHGAWQWHFEGEELKIGIRGGQRNVFEVNIDPQVAPYLEEYLTRWRPLLPNSAKDRHVFLSWTGRPLTAESLRDRLQIQVFRFTQKRIYPHLLRTIFASNHLSAGVDINSVAYGVGDHPLTILIAYNELQAEKHQQNLQEANRLALNGHGQPKSR